MQKHPGSIDPHDYIDTALVHAQNRDLSQTHKFIQSHACPQAEIRFLEILRPIYERTHRQGTILHKNNEPIGILKQYKERTVLSFGTQYPLGIYWLDADSWQQREKSPRNGYWLHLENPQLELFPVRKLRGPYADMTRQHLRREYELLQTQKNTHKLLPLLNQQVSTYYHTT